MELSQQSAHRLALSDPVTGVGHITVTCSIISGAVRHGSARRFGRVRHRSVASFKSGALTALYPGCMSNDQYGETARVLVVCATSLLGRNQQLPAASKEPTDQPTFVRNCMRARSAALQQCVAP